MKEPLWNNIMGSTYLFRCTKCDYKVESSGELDWGMLAVVRPFICKDCTEVVDVTIGECGQVFEKNTKEKLRVDGMYKCPICKGENITVWHPRYRKCPKCGGWMKRDKGGPIMLWD